MNQGTRVSRYLDFVFCRLFEVQGKNLTFSRKKFVTFHSDPETKGLIRIRKLNTAYWNPVPDPEATCDTLSRNPTSSVSDVGLDWAPVPLPVRPPDMLLFDASETA